MVAPRGEAVAGSPQNQTKSLLRLLGAKSVKDAQLARSQEELVVAPQPEAGQPGETGVAKKRRTRVIKLVDTELGTLGAEVASDSVVVELERLVANTPPRMVASKAKDASVAKRPQEFTMPDCGGGKRLCKGDSNPLVSLLKRPKTPVDTSVDSGVVIPERRKSRPPVPPPAAWGDRYAPANIQKDLRPTKTWTHVREWLEAWKAAGGNCVPHGQHGVLLITGPPGCGKSAGVALVGRKFYGQVQEYDALEREGSALLENIVRKQLNYDQVSSQTLVVFDLPRDPSARLRERLSLAAAAAQRPVVFLAEDGALTSKDTVMGQCDHLQMRLSRAVVQRFLRDVIKSERLVDSCGTAEALSMDCGSDLRRALASLRLLAVGGKLAAMPPQCMAASLTAICGHLLSIRNRRYVSAALSAGRGGCERAMVGTRHVVAAPPKYADIGLEAMSSLLSLVDIDEMHAVLAENYLRAAQHGVSEEARRARLAARAVSDAVEPSLVLVPEIAVPSLERVAIEASIGPAAVATDTPNTEVVVDIASKTKTSGDDVCQDVPVPAVLTAGDIAADAAEDAARLHGLIGAADAAEALAVYDLLTAGFRATAWAGGASGDSILAEGFLMAAVGGVAHEGCSQALGDALHPAQPLEGEDCPGRPVISLETCTRISRELQLPRSWVQEQLVAFATSKRCRLSERGFRFYVRRRHSFLFCPARISVNHEGGDGQDVEADWTEAEVRCVRPAEEVDGFPYGDV